MAKKKKSKKTSLFKLRGHHPAAYVYIAIAIVAGVMFGIAQNAEASSKYGRVNIYAATQRCGQSSPGVTTCKYYKSRSSLRIGYPTEKGAACSNGKKTAKISRSGVNFGSVPAVNCTPGIYTFLLENPASLQTDTGKQYKVYDRVKVIKGKAQPVFLGSSK